MKLLLCTVMFFLISCLSAAEILFPLDGKGWDLNKKAIIDKRYLHLLGVSIGISTFDDVTNILGKSEAYKTSSKNYAPSLLCYQSVHDDIAVIFQSGPLGGWHVVTAIWIGNANLINTTRCAKSKLVSRKTARMNSLSLNLKPSDVKNIFGDATFNSPLFCAYRFEDEIVLDDDRAFNISSGFEFGFNGHKLSWFRVYRQLSN